MRRFECIPTPCIQVIPVDFNGAVLVHHRSDKVRSAKNVWSFPTGIIEYGETMRDAARRELKEEFELIGGAVMHLGCYENILDDFHWVLSVMGTVVPSVYDFKNMEPDKHDIVEAVHMTELMSSTFFKRYPFHQSFQNWINLDVITKLGLLSRGEVTR